MINHHPSAELLLGYAAGTLTAGFALLTATHASMCERCRRKISHAESIGGALLYATDPAEVSEHALPELLARIEGLEPDAAGEPRRTPETGSTVPAPLRRFVAGPYEDLRWRTLAPGMKHIVLPLGEARPAKTRLLRLAPGVATPVHSHKGHELTLVLQGSFGDELGRFGPGDLQETDHSVKHQPMADTGEDCICLIATDAPLKFDNLVGKILQPIFGY